MSSKIDIAVEFNQLKHDFSCKTCHKLITNPISLNTCGHIQCESCLDDRKMICSICKYPYTKVDVSNSSFTQSVIESIQNIEKILNGSYHQNLATSVVEDNGFFNGNFEIVIAQNSPKKNHKGESPLHLACKKGMAKKVLDIINSGADINATDWGNWSPLHEAVQGKHYDCAELLLKKGALVDIPGIYYMTPLHEAASINAEDIIELLLRYGADINATDYYGKTALSYLVDAEKFKLIEPTAKCIPKVFFKKEIIAYAPNISHSRITFFSNRGVKFVNQQQFRQKDDVTHLILKDDNFNLDILFGILKGIIIVTEEWMHHSPLKIPPFEFVPKTYKETVRTSIQNNLECKPKLFNGINFHILDHDEPIKFNDVELSKKDFTQLIESGRGKVVSRSPALRTVENEHLKPYHSRDTENLKECCNYIIYNEMKKPELVYNMKELQHKSSKWLIECILSFKIID